MSQDSKGEQPERRDFFISYTSSDQPWAEWIAQQLEAAGYTLFIQAWDFRPGSNFVAGMDNAVKRAERTLLVLSPAYLESDVAFSEWAAAFRHDPRGTHRGLLPVRVEPCKVEGLLGQMVYIDLVTFEEEQARERLLAGVQREHKKPATAAFPPSHRPHEPHPYVAFPGAFPEIWNIPYPRNPVFTGRKQILTQLAKALQTGKVTALSQPQAISGLGGIGKTQIAVEYAYRHHQDYTAVLWTRADTREALISGYVEIADLLNLPQKGQQDQTTIVNAVLQWLKAQTAWLLILDNADDLAIVHEFLPPLPAGHILLTTRAQATGLLAKRVEVETMDTDTGALLLLRRAGLIAQKGLLKAASASDAALARALTQELGGLPLALDQAGAYIEETNCGLSAYQVLYRQHRTDLLNKRGRLVSDHPEPVTTTWSLSFQKVEQLNAAAADLLRFCAHLAPDAIPEEIIIAGAKHLGPLLQPLGSDSLAFNDALAILGLYSLVHRDVSAKTLSVHRLVQAVLRDTIQDSEQEVWITRVIAATNTIFPDVEPTVWWQCKRLVAHALACVVSTQTETSTSMDLAALLFKLAHYLHERGQYTEAEPLYQRAIHIREQVLGSSHPDVAYSFNMLVKLYSDQGKYEQAKLLLQQALLILEQTLGPDHLRVAYMLNNLGSLYYYQGKYEQAEPLLQRTLPILEQALGSEHPKVGYALISLANLQCKQSKYEQAEPLLQQALLILERALGPDHLDVAYSLISLAVIYREQDKLKQAEPLLQRALLIREQALGSDHPDVAYPLNNLGNLYHYQGKYEQAEPLLQRALSILEQALGSDHPNVADLLYSQAILHSKQGKHEQAEPLLQRALSILEPALGPDHPNIARLLNALANLYSKQGKYEQAEPLHLRALRVAEQALGPDHPDVTYPLYSLAYLYREQDKYEQAESLYQRVLLIRTQHLGSQHTKTIDVIHDFALLQNAQGNKNAAKSLYSHALMVREQILGKHHPDTIETRNHFIALLHAMGLHEEATLHEQGISEVDRKTPPE